MADSNIRGGRELSAFLSALPAKLEKNIMRSALRAGAVVIRDEAKANVPVDQGLLQKSVRISSGTKRGTVTGTVKAGGRMAPHAHLVEYGTRPHKIEPKNAGALAINGTPFRSVEHPGARPQPFMRPALDAKAPQAIEAIAAQIRKRLTAEGINVPAPEIV
ncbi:hypothetical protein CR152_10210 [Massilia violaceinigra]|uniref:HK97 gp10 family phage protein n=1 Tax=Massilia violaceinigra TaxID=2045208 RepID=A0A2D2DIQ0_9BURK|nr:HK97-gp10 family putative phage morphogenesis protein [Massilia violaceinigra]ATQ74854.1 hypothetical protein CR152_10210 [Massilia violaceinigra]